MAGRPFPGGRLDAGNGIMWESGSPVYQEALRRLLVYARHELTVVLEGETGTGKELFAQALHEKSGRARGPLIPVNMAGVPSTLFESLFFGHRKGAFTGAQETRDGFFGSADGGTLFLDEFNSMDPDLQPKLLRVLETRHYLAVGEFRPRKTDARVVLATNIPLDRLRETGRLREDLYFRLVAHRIRIPALRERLMDLPELVSAQVKRIAAELGREGVSVPDASMRALLSYGWPGNVRELSEKLRSAVLHTTDGVLSIPLLFPDASKEECVPYSVAKEKFDFEYFVEMERRSGGDLSIGRRLSGLSETTYRRKLRRIRRPPASDAQKKHPGMP
ncbi:hypothetical protein BOX30_04915 [Leptospirillum ferriphilum]|jgi:DNA-binding NtrC family response regulator|nr:hypothetical protein BOX30_04915 [Leptospirillum ferriphilum]